MSATLYIFRLDTLQLAARVSGSTATTCENRALLDYAGDEFGWTYSRDFGFSDGPAVVDIDADGR